MPSIAISAEGQEERVQLSAAVVTLGRGLESDVRLKDIKSSRRHCQIVKTADGFKVVDLGSGNGTFLNGVQIKEQRLNSGDKIQIGATVITFENGEKAAAKPTAATTTQQKRGETRSLPRPTAAVPTGKAAPAKTTAPVPKAATAGVKPATSRVPTGQHPAVGKTTASTGKGGTSRITKAASPTSLSRATTGKMTTSSRKTQSASSRYTMEASKKKANPIAIVIGIAGAFVLVVVAFFIFGGSGDDEGQHLYDKREVEGLLAKGQAQEDANNYPAAIKLYEEALKKIDGKERFKVTASEIRAKIAAAKQGHGDVDEANKAWQEFLAEYEKPSGEPGTKPPEDLLEMARKLKGRYGASTLPWLPDLQQRIEQLEKIIDTNRAIADREDYQTFANELNSKCNLGKRDAALFGKAIQAWKNEFIPKAKEKNKGEAVRRAEAEIVKWNGVCKELLLTAQKRAEGKDKAEALAVFEKILPQVEGSDVEAEFRAEMKKHQ